MSGDLVRIDKWLWAVRVYKTRAKANDACSSGRVRVNGEVAKPATKVKQGHSIEVRRRDRTLIIEVVRPIEKRVSASLAVEAYVDHSPPAPDRPSTPEDIVLAAGRRERGAGRPTKRDRRRLEEMKRKQ